MGMTLVTLNLYGVRPSDVTDMIAPGDQLRGQNPPWLTVVPEPDANGDDFRRMMKMAKKVTKDSEVSALLFYYLDDDMFSCELYQKGKKIASCDSDQSWTKLGKKLSGLLGDDGPSKAFRFASQCTDLEEKLHLFEESVGISLFETREEEPRIVRRGDTTLERIKTRKSMLKNRPNRFKLTEIGMEDWPDDQKNRMKLMEFLQARGMRSESSTVLYRPYDQYIIPNTDDLIAFPYTADWNSGIENLILLDRSTGESSEIGPVSGRILNTIWKTKNGGVVVLLAKAGELQNKDSANARIYRVCSVVCINRDGTEQWSFEPDIPHQTIQFINSSDDGIITVFASGINAVIKADTLIWQINGETGELLNTYRYPYMDGVYHIIHSDELKAFLFCRSSKNELVLVDESFEEIRSIRDFKGGHYFSTRQLCGSLLWYDYGQRHIYIYDLKDGSHINISLEIPAYIALILKDGRILGVNDKQNLLTVFDDKGTVMARCHVQGMLYPDYAEENIVCLVEILEPVTGRKVYNVVHDEIQCRVWRLDEVR